MAAAPDVPCSDLSRISPAMSIASFPVRRAHPLRLVLTGGVLAGALDITYACLFWRIKAGLPASRIFQSVAAGLLGTASFKGGTATAWLGLGLHFFIAGCMALGYYLAARRWPALRHRPLAYGAVYGLGLYAVMNYLVVPLSAARGGSRDPLWIGLSVLVHMFLIGVPIAWLSGRAATQD
jgi:hypothetical protein